MAQRTGWKILRPEEQLSSVIRTVNRLIDDRRYYTRLQGIRLESRVVGGERRLYAVVDDVDASNDGVSYQLAP